MKILLIGNYVNNRQQSMQRFAELMQAGLEEAGQEVRMIHPPAIFGKLKPNEAGLGKWLGYIDRFLLFRRRLRREAAWADVVHICDQANAVYAPWLKGKAHLVTCHDMLAIRSALDEVPENPVRWSGRVYQRWILSGLRRAQHVACGSRQTREELLRVTSLPPERTSVATYALNYPYNPMPPEEALSRLQAVGLGGKTSFFVHVGGNQWYKNRTGVLRIFAKLIQSQDYQNHYMVMAGKLLTAEMRRLVQDLRLEESVVELGEVSNEVLHALYSLAEGLVFPSQAEGFGWPIIEAQACGCPVFASGRSPLTEVGGVGAAYFDPMDGTSAAKVVVQALTEKDRLRAAGFQNAAGYSKSAMIGSYLNVYRMVIAKGE